MSKDILRDDKEMKILQELKSKDKEKLAELVIQEYLDSNANAANLGKSVMEIIKWYVKFNS